MNNPDLSGELAKVFTDAESYLVSEPSVYRPLKAASPALI
ncbi:hypothetical protein X738_24645 [Mesorhizobium sp. LNHC209A00]|nr:hypothetical protein X738_24645 [Mesorhizobium sp. LNHC209A00]